MATPQQKTNFITDARNYGEQLRRLMDNGAQLKNQWDDLGLAGTLIAEDFTGENAGIVPADFTAAITAIGSDLAQWTVAQRQAINRIGRGRP